MAEFVTSAGIAMYRIRDNCLEVYTVKPAGPWHKKSPRSLPKGKVNDGEDERTAAVREFHEETGIAVPEDAMLLDLGSADAKGKHHKGGKKVLHIWAWRNDEFDDSVPSVSNEYEIEWPPHSGKMRKYPEVEDGKFMPVDATVKNVNPATASILKRLAELEDGE